MADDDGIRSNQGPESEPVYRRSEGQYNPLTQFSEHQLETRQDLERPTFQELFAQLTAHLQKLIDAHPEIYFSRSYTAEVTSQLRALLHNLMADQSFLAQFPDNHDAVEHTLSRQNLLDAALEQLQLEFAAARLLPHALKNTEIKFAILNAALDQTIAGTKLAVSFHQNETTQPPQAIINATFEVRQVSENLATLPLTPESDYGRVQPKITFILTSNPEVRGETLPNTPYILTTVVDAHTFSLEHAECITHKLLPYLQALGIPISAAEWSGVQCTYSPNSEIVLSFPHALETQVTNTLLKMLGDLCVTLEYPEQKETNWTQPELYTYYTDLSTIVINQLIPELEHLDELDAAARTADPEIADSQLPSYFMKEEVLPVLLVSLRENFPSLSDFELPEREDAKLLVNRDVLTDLAVHTLMVAFLLVIQGILKEYHGLQACSWIVAIAIVLRSLPKSQEVITRIPGEYTIFDATDSLVFETFAD